MNKQNYRISRNWRLLHVLRKQNVCTLLTCRYSRYCRVNICPVNYSHMYLLNRYLLTLLSKLGEQFLIEFVKCTYSLSFMSHFSMHECDSERAIRSVLRKFLKEQNKSDTSYNTLFFSCVYHYTYNT